MKAIFEHLNNLKLDDEDFKEMEVSEVEKARVKAKLKQSIGKKQSHHMSKQSTQKKWGYGIGAAVLAFGLLVASSMVSPAMATVLSSIPGISSIFSYLGDTGQKNVSELDLTEVVEQSKTVNGITISLREIFYDGTRFNISYSIVSEKPIVEQYIEVSGYKIDKQVVPGGIGINNIIETPTETVGFLQVDPYWKDKPQPEELNLELTFKGQSGEQWSFTNPVTKQNNKEIDIDHSEKRGDFRFTVNQVILGPGGILLNYEAISWERGRLEDFLRFRVVDSSGKELQILEGSVYDGDGKILYEPINDTVDELTITPYLDIPKEIKYQNGATVDMKIYENKNYKFNSFNVKIPR